MVHQQDDGRFYQEGINSHGVFCGNLLAVAVHTEVRAYIEWITSNIEAYDNASKLEYLQFQKECGIRGFWRVMFFYLSIHRTISYKYYQARSEM